MQDEGVDHTENYRVCANSQCQCQNRDAQESGGFTQDAKADANILEKSVEKIAANSLLDFFFEALLSAELNAGAAFCLPTTQAGTLEIVSAMLDMRAKLLLHLLIEFRTMKKLCAKRTNVGQELHTSSGWAASAEAMAPARRFHPAVSSRKRLRPAVVSS